MIDLIRLRDKLESFFARHDLAGAEQLLLYWRQEALAQGDEVGLTQVDNELLGLYRRTNDKDKALAVAERLLPRLAPDNVGDATIRLNIATNYCHFGMPDVAAPLYREVEGVFLAHLAPNDYRLAGLYNNMGAMAGAVKDYADAEDLYRKALYVVRQIEPIIPEVSVTLVNLAVSIYMQNPLRQDVDVCMREAYDVLDDPAIPRDGNYAFVLGKVIPIFKHLGYREETDCLTRRLQLLEQML